MPPASPERPVTVDFASMAALLRVAAAPERAQILLMLGGGGCPEDEMAAEAGLSVTAFRHHLRRLQLAGLVSTRPVGRRHLFSLTEAGRAMHWAVKMLGG